MTINLNIISPETLPVNGRSYPWVGIYKERSIVLFVGPSTGIQLNSIYSCAHLLRSSGILGTDYMEELFIPYNESVTVTFENKE